MTRVVLYPFPRLPERSIQWRDWDVLLDGRAVRLDEVADQWDADSALTFRISVSIHQRELGLVSDRPENARLVAAVTCHDTAYTATADTALHSGETDMSGSLSLTVLGRDIAQMLELRAQVVGPMGSAEDTSSAWLQRCVLADGPAVQEQLDSALIGFPTVAFSFDRANYPDAPWRIAVTATDAEEAFANSIRLELNEDYPLVRQLMDGEAEDHVANELIASITRVLIGTISRLIEDETTQRSPDEVAAEAPSSIAAASARAAKQYLLMSLGEAVKVLRAKPEEFEYYLANGTGILRGKRS